MKPLSDITVKTHIIGSTYNLPTYIHVKLNLIIFPRDMLEVGYKIDLKVSISLQDLAVFIGLL